MSNEINIPTSEDFIEMDKPAIVEYLDPDWTDHFPDVDMAFDHYKRYCLPSKWIEALKSVQ